MYIFKPKSALASCSSLRRRSFCPCSVANALALASIFSFLLLVWIGTVITDVEEQTDANFSPFKAKAHDEGGASPLASVEVDPSRPEEPPRLQPKDKLFFDKIERRMRERRRAVDAVCSREGAGRFRRRGRKPTIMYPPIPTYENIVFNLKDKIGWCPVYKAASTSWFYNLGALAGWTEQQIQASKFQIADLMKRIYPPLSFEDGEKAINETEINFFIVRHPFERILSAYRDKLENRKINKKHGSEHFYKAYGRKIVKKYRNKPLVMDIETKNLSVPQMPGERPSGNRYNYPPPSDGAEPTFMEFVRYLIDVRFTDTDDHWLPFYLTCSPCSVTYDVIAKFETLEEDTKYIISKLKLEDKIKPTWKHITNGKQTSEVIKKYFSTIPKYLLVKLYEKYKVDFQMFEYDIQKYYNYVQ